MKYFDDVGLKVWRAVNVVKSGYFGTRWDDEFYTATIACIVDCVQRTETRSDIGRAKRFVIFHVSFQFYAK